MHAAVWIALVLFVSALLGAVYELFDYLLRCEEAQVYRQGEGQPLVIDFTERRRRAALDAIAGGRR